MRFQAPSWCGRERRAQVGGVSPAVLGRAAGAPSASARPEGLWAAASRWVPVACGPCYARLSPHLEPAPVHIALQPSVLRTLGGKWPVAMQGQPGLGLEPRVLSGPWETGWPGEAAGCRARPSPTPVRRGVCQRERCFWGDGSLSDSTSSVGDTGSWQDWSHPLGAVFGPERPKH